MTKLDFKIILVIVIGAIFSYLIGDYVAGERRLQREYQRYETQMVCEQALRSGNDILCHYIEKQYGTEFICQDLRLDTTSLCWVELGDM